MGLGLDTYALFKPMEVRDLKLISVEVKSAPGLIAE